MEDKRKRKVKKPKFSESDLAEKIINYLENDGWISYKEVCISKGGGSRSDSYFVKKDMNGKIKETLSVETKLSLTLKVIEQAENWLKYANRCYICIPTPKREARSSYWFGIKVCKKFNIGVFEVNMSTGNIRELYSPTINNNTDIPPLYEQQRASVAGNDRGEYVTAFKITVMNIDEYMKDKDSHELRKVLSDIEHHYSNVSSGTAAIKKLIKKNVIKSYEIKKVNTKIFIFKK